MATSQTKGTAPKKGASKPALQDTTDLETQFPLSEKDEVKKAEQRISKAVKNK
jgi:hypothetical protein